MTNPDGALQPAIARLHDAIHRLCGPQMLYAGDQLRRAPSRYMQLFDATAGEQVNSGGGAGGKSRPPLWLDAFDLRNEIDSGVEILQPAFSGVPATVGRLQWIREKRWRPQDTHKVEQITQACNEWAAGIDALLNPPRVWTLPSPCPSCNTAIVYRRDSGGEPIRQPALQVGVDGCTCIRCHATWGPERFVFLAKVLGYETPSGVLE